MKNIKLDDVQPGMVIARDVKGRFGRGLLLVGNIVTEKHIRIFKSWGITELVVEKNPEVNQQASKQNAPVTAEFQGVERQVKELFKFNDARHPAIRELFQIVMDKKMKAYPPLES